jgi:hypothetical protein
MKHSREQNATMTAYAALILGIVVLVFAVVDRLGDDDDSADDDSSIEETTH